MTIDPNEIQIDMWGDYAPIETAGDYIESLRGRGLKVYAFGELLDEPVDHPLIRPSINAMAQTYQLAQDDPDLASSISPYVEKPVNRFLHIMQDGDDLVQKVRMQKLLGQQTGTCFQRCVGLDAINALHSISFDIDKARQTSYHSRFLEFLKHPIDHVITLIS